MNIKRVLGSIKNLISEKEYGELAKKIINGLTFGYGRAELAHNIAYLRLKKKYRAFIADYVRTHTHHDRPKGHKDIIWWLWYQGVDEAPDICKACLASLRRWHPEKEIITLDKNNISQYITFPEHIYRKHEQGIIDNTKYSNLIRLQLLIQYGGTWIDSTIFCTGRKFEHIMHLPLFLFREEHFFTNIVSQFMVSDPDDPILQLTRDLHYEYWKEHDYLMDYYIIHMFFKMATEAYQQEWDSVPVIMSDVHLAILMAVAAGERYSEERMKYFASISDFHKFSWKIHESRLWNMPSGYSVHIIDEYKKGLQQQ